MMEMTEVNVPLVQFTASALTELKRIRTEEPENKDKYLRVGAKGGGCSGLSYVLEYDETKTTFDEVMHIEDIEVVMDKRHAIYVMGMEVDYQYGLNDRGFIFRNPNAKDSCGCGVSFST